MILNKPFQTFFTLKNLGKEEEAGGDREKKGGGACPFGGGLKSQKSQEGVYDT